MWESRSLPGLLRQKARCWIQASGFFFPPAGTSLDYHATLEETKRALIVRAFDLAGHSHAAAARLLGVHPNYLHRLISNFSLRTVIGGSGRS